MIFNLKPEEVQILIDSMRDRIGKLYKMAESYRDGCNKEATMDCLEEKRRVQNLLEIFNESTKIQ